MITMPCSARAGQEAGVLGLIVEVMHQVVHAGAHGCQLLDDGFSVDAEVGVALLELLLHGGHPHHEKLIEIGDDDGGELHALQQLIPGIAGFFENAPLEFEQAELPVHVQGGVVKIGCERRVGALHIRSGGAIRPDGGALPIRRRGFRTGGLSNWLSFFSCPVSLYPLMLS